MARVSERAEKYLFHIVEQMEANNIPMEIALLPIVESAFDPFAYSHGRASGMWQFVPSTGRQYGLKQNWWYDGRRDVVASTGAAIKFLSYLHRRFDGDWLLALAAYNSGEGNVSKAIRRNRKAGKPTDFWSLKLPRETQAYVPQLLALSRVVLKPDTHKVKLEPIPNKAWFTQVDIHSQIDLAQAARLADMELNELYKYNPAFNRWATDPDGPHQLLIPNTHLDTFVENLKAMPTDQRIGWKRYTIKSGDSLIRIAKKFNTSVSALQSANQMKGNKIRQGKTLMIPVATEPARYYAYSADQRLKRKQDKPASSKNSHKINYRVKSGDSFWKISRQHNVSVSKLSKWNGMAPKDPLKVGQKLVIWTNKTLSESRLKEAGKSLDKGIIRKLAYNVRRGDSLARIAGKFNLSVNDIMRWNPVKKDSYIHPGQSLTLFVDVTRTN
jgi:membrane-bound lytic murein transglycosylase D